MFRIDPVVDDRSVPGYAPWRERRHISIQLPAAVKARAKAASSSVLIPVKGSSVIARAAAVEVARGLSHAGDVGGRDSSTATSDDR